MTSPESRMLFEQWAASYGIDTRRWKDDSGYIDCRARDAEAAWSARTMPVEALQEAARSLRREAMQAERDEILGWGATLHSYAAALTQLLEQGK